MNQPRQPRPLFLVAAAAALAAPFAAWATLATAASVPPPPTPPLSVDKAFTGKPVGTPELVASFSGPNVVGVAVSREARRIFVSFPRTIDLGAITLGEWKNGQTVPYPNRALNTFDLSKQAVRLNSVQGITVDGKNRLWALDTGKIKEDPIRPGAGGAKLVCIDLHTNRVIRTIPFPATVAGPDAYLNDVRIDLRVGAQGTAFISDSSEKGPNGIVVVDLATGNSHRRLNDHPSTKAEPDFTAVVEGQSLLVRRAGQAPTHDKTGIDGLCLSGDGSFLYYCPNAGHHWYRVSTKALADLNTSDDAAAAATVTEMGDKGFASDGIEGDGSGRVFLTDYEHDAIQMHIPGSGGTVFQPVARIPTMVWPDSISVGADGYLYYTSNQLNRRPQFHHGSDLRRKPYVLYRVKVPGLVPQ